MLDQTPAPRWRPATRIAFRFCFLYFSLYAVISHVLNELHLGDVLDTDKVMRGPIVWVGRTVFHATVSLAPSGSGDRLYDWLEAFCFLILAAAGTVVWSALDRKRDQYARLDRWFRVALRFTLGSIMISYGFAKAIPMQMPAPPLTRLLEPYGNFSPMGALWYSIGASFPYESFVGCAECLGGILLFIPRTALLGALVCLGCTIEIFTLNMTYDVPVKQFSFHLILMSVFLLAPDIKRLTSVVFAKGARTRWAAIAQITVGAYLVGMSIYGHIGNWYEFGGGVPKPALYGIWVIDEMKIDGITRAPLITDWARWRRVVIQRTTDISFWRMNDTVLSYGAKTDMEKKTISMTKPSDNAWSAQLTFDRPAEDKMIFEGSIDGHAIHMETHLVKRQDFLLVNRGFHWIQEIPFNR